jgi:putative ABC transport system permease protein
VVIINETMARRYWPDRSPLGERIAIGRSVMPEFADEPERQVIGVVADFRDDDPGSRVHEQIYVPQGHVSDRANALLLEGRRMSWAIRARGRAGVLSAAIQEELRSASGLPVTDVSTMGAVVSRLTSRKRFNMLLMTVFGARSCCWPSPACPDWSPTRSSSADVKSAS